MKTLAIIATSTLALSAAACGAPRGTQGLGKLDCPSRQGDLRKVGAAADGKSCAYLAENGTEVSLRLIPVSGGVEPALAKIERELATLAPTPAAAKPANGPSSAAAADAATVARQAEEDTASDGVEDADNSESDENTHVDLPGIHINTDGDDARIEVGGIHIDANDGHARVALVRDVRLKGEAFSRVKRGVRATLILTSDSGEGAYRFVGYEAAGPRAGPLAVAVVKSKTGDHDEMDGDVRRLVRRNGGV